jgi:hypothetical protein
MKASPSFHHLVCLPVANRRVVNEAGYPMLGSALVQDPKFRDRVAAETRALLSTIPTSEEER